MIAILDYGIGNLASVRNAFEATGAHVIITTEPQAVLDASGLVVPGVGAFGKAMQNLSERQLIEPIVTFLETGKPFLGICLGLQLLFSESHEGGRCAGLGVMRGTVERLEVDLKVPHIGWNQIEKKQECAELEGVPDGTFFYFVHSYRVVPEDDTVVATETEYGDEFVSAVKKDNIFACQFHPERSGSAGLQVIRNFLRIAEDKRPQKE